MVSGTECRSIVLLGLLSCSGYVTFPLHALARLRLCHSSSRCFLLLLSSLKRDGISLQIIHDETYRLFEFLPCVMLSCYQFYISCLVYKWKIYLRMGCCPAMHSSPSSPLLCTHSDSGEIRSGLVIVIFMRAQWTCKHTVENKNISEKNRKGSFRTIPIISWQTSSFSKFLYSVIRDLPDLYLWPFQ